MRIADDCNSCPDGRALVYCTIQGERYITRYRCCDECGETSKSIALKTVLSSKHSVEPEQANATIDGERFTLDHSHGE